MLTLYSLQRAEQLKPLFNQILLGLSMAVVLIGLGGLLGQLLGLGWLASYSLGTLPDMTVPTAVGIIFMGLGVKTILDSQPYEKMPQWLWPIRYLAIIIPASIGIYYIGLYLQIVDYHILSILVQPFPGIGVSFLAAVNLCLIALAMLMFLIRHHVEAAVIYGVCFPALLLLFFNLFAVIGHVLKIPVLYNFMLSLPGAIAFTIAALALLVATLPFKGLLLPLFSRTLKGRLIAIMALAIGFGILLQGFWIIFYLHQIHVSNLDNVSLELEHRKLYIILGFAAIILASLVKLLALRAVHYFNESNFYAYQQAELARRENVIRQIIQLVHSTADLDTLFELLTRELGTHLAADHCFISCYDLGTKLLIPPTREYRASTDVPRLVNIDPTLWITSKSGFTAQICQRKEPLLYTYEAEGFSEETRAFLARTRLKSGVGCPIVYQDTCLAVLFVHQITYNRSWQKEEVILIEEVAQQVALAMHQNELYWREQEAKREAEAAKRNAELASQRKTQALSNLSHEFKNPLNAIIGYGEMLQKGVGISAALAENQKKYIDNIVVSGHHLLQMVNDILDIARIEAGKIQLVPEMIAVETLVSEVVEMTHALAVQHQVALQVQIQPEVDQASWDPLRVRQILLNFISNAIKFSKPGGKVTITVGKRSDQQDIFLQIQDQGIGIPQEKLPEIFTEFYQAGDGQHTSWREGHGLGLPLSKRLVELHGGTIVVESKEGVGSTFTVTLPIHFTNPAVIPEQIPS